jgi:hypothetical protein
VLKSSFGLTIAEPSFARNTKRADRIEIAAQSETRRPAPLSLPPRRHRLVVVVYLFRKYPAKSRHPSAWIASLKAVHGDEAAPSLKKFFGMFCRMRSYIRSIKLSYTLTRGANAIVFVRHQPTNQWIIACRCTGAYRRPLFDIDIKIKRFFVFGRYCNPQGIKTMLKNWRLSDVLTASPVQTSQAPLISIRSCPCMPINYQINLGQFTCSVCTW